MPLQAVAEYYGLDWKTVKAIDKAYLNRTLQPANLDNVRVIGVDEVAKCKGHNYLTIVYNLRTNHLIWVGDGRSKETLGQFFELLGPQRCKQTSLRTGTSPVPTGQQPKQIRTVTITADNAPIFSGPGTTYAVITTVPAGVELILVDDSKRWYYQVKLPDGKSGWVSYVNCQK